MVKEKQSKVVEALKGLLKERGVYPSKIIIFGSQAKAKAKKDSDIDIIVISVNFEGKNIFERVKIAAGIHQELVKKFMLPLDIMYYSLFEWEKGSSPIIEIARREGAVYS